MEMERRGEDNQIPDGFDDELNEEQLFTVSKMEGYGWKLAFIRRPLFQDIVTVMFHPDNNSLGVLEGDGTLNMQPDIEFR